MLQDASHPLPVAWDGRKVDWEPWERSTVQICPTPPRARCACGANASPFTARGLRHPASEDLARAEAIPRIGRRTALVAPRYDLFATRCPACGEVSVWDMVSDQHWVLDEADYGGATGSWEWSGGLLDQLLIDAED